MTSGSASGESAPRIGISSCLLGDEVRYDGGHKRFSFLADVLSAHVEWIRVCPEVEIGLGVPREPIQLVRSRTGTRLRATGSGEDLTERMITYAEQRVAQLGKAGLDGYVLKSRSPSCGVDDVKLFAPARGTAFDREGRGLFAISLLRLAPELPIVQETDLEAREGQRHFVERVFAQRRIRRLVESRRESLEAFHERHELQIIAHSAGARRHLSRIAHAARLAEYRRVFCEALALPVPRERHPGVFRRALNRIRARLSADAGDELERLVRDYESGRVTHEQVRKKVRDAAFESRDSLLMNQTYLDPEAAERLLLAELRAPRAGS